MAKTVFCYPASFYIILHDVLDNCEITVFECIIDTSAGSTLLMLPELLVLAPGRAIHSSDPCKIPIGATAFQLGEMSSIINFKFRGQYKIGNFMLVSTDEQVRGA